MRPSLFSFLGGVAFAVGAFVLAGMQSGGPGTAISGDVREFLSHIQMVDLDDGAGGTVRTARLAGLNLQIVNGDENSPANGLGNLIVGYNIDYGGPAAIRTGSHNLVGGQRSEYRGSSGIVWGHNNSIADSGAIALGGEGNVAGGPNSVALGGSFNRAGPLDDKSGENLGAWSVVVGGSHNTTLGWWSVASGGYGNLPYHDHTTVTGGESNIAYGPYASISGGLDRMTTDWHDWAAGSLYEDQ